MNHSSELEKIDVSTHVLLQLPVKYDAHDDKIAFISAADDIDDTTFASIFENAKDNEFAFAFSEDSNGGNNRNNDQGSNDSNEDHGNDDHGYDDHRYDDSNNDHGNDDHGNYDIDGMHRW